MKNAILICTAVVSTTISTLAQENLPNSIFEISNKFKDEITIGELQKLRSIETNQKDLEVTGFILSYIIDRLLVENKSTSKHLTEQMVVNNKDFPIGSKIYIEKITLLSNGDTKKPINADPIILLVTK